MPQLMLPSFSSSPPARGPCTGRARPVALACATVLALLAAPAARALDFGPFSLTGFALAELRSTTNVCENCQREPGEARHRLWADDVVFGKPFGTQESHVTLFQPYLGFKQNVGGGWQVFGLLSQRWRDGKVDLPGWMHERNAGVAHEDYGRLTVGAMTTRGWSMADFPYGFRAIGSDGWGGASGSSTVWSDSGAGYGLLSRAVRYMTRPIGFLGGDLLLEGTYDMGQSGWKRNKPQFMEFFAKYIARDLTVDLVLQSAKNGEPVAWGKAPFGGLTPFSEDDALLGSSSQGMAMLMVRRVFNGNLEASAGVRHNRWSGAYAVQTTPGALGRWNSMFNVNWGGVDANGIANPGYPARSTDLMLGLRYRVHSKLTAGVSLTHLGKADTANPSDRGQNNTLTVGTLSVGYNVDSNVRVFGSASVIQFGRKGQAPLAIPAHDAHTNIDSRVASRGNSVGLGFNITF